MGLKLSVKAHWRHKKLTYEYQFYNLPNTKVTTAKEHGKSYINVRRFLVRHFSVIVGIISFPGDSGQTPAHLSEIRKPYNSNDP